MAKRRRRLRSLKIHEVSWVDAPANLVPFLFIKRDSGMDIDKKQLDLTLEFSTKGIASETTLKINGRKIADPKNFSLYYSPISSTDAIALECSYTVEAVGENKDGFTAARTYRLWKNVDGVTKGTPNLSPEQEVVLSDGLDKDKKILDDMKVKKANPEHLETLVRFLGDKEIDPDPNIAGALAEHVDVVMTYQDDMPVVLVNAIKSIVKLATETEVEETCPTEENTMQKDDEKADDGSDTNEGNAIDTGKLVSEITEQLLPKVKEQIDAALQAHFAQVEKPQSSEDKPKDDEKEPEEEMVELDEDKLAEEAMQEVMEEQVSSP